MQENSIQNDTKSLLQFLPNHHHQVHIFTLTFSKKKRAPKALQTVF